MQEETTTKILSNIEAHTNALVRREQEINRKLVQAELLMSRYKNIHSIAISLTGINKMDEARKIFSDTMVSRMNFQKTLILSTADNVVVENAYGFTEDEKKVMSTKQNELIESLNNAFKEIDETHAFNFVKEDSNFENLIGLKTFLISREVYKKRNFYVLCGYDSKNGAFYESKYPLSKDDISWFAQLILLWSTTVDRIDLYQELNSKAEENEKLARQREAEIAERTRSLLDALYDTKKYKLALELADVMVILADTASRKVIYANEQFEKISGFKRDFIVSRKTLEYFDVVPIGGAFTFFSKEFESILKEGGTARGMYVVKAQNGDEKQLDISTSRFEEEEGGSIYVIICRDVTNERNVQKREKEYAENIEKLNKLIVNRELRIIELKRKVAQIS